MVPEKVADWAMHLSHDRLSVTSTRITAVPVAGRVLGRHFRDPFAVKVPPRPAAASRPGMRPQPWPTKRMSDLPNGLERYADLIPWNIDAAAHDEGGILMILVMIFVGQAAPAPG